MLGSQGGMEHFARFTDENYIIMKHNQVLEFILTNVFILCNVHLTKNYRKFTENVQYD